MTTNTTINTAATSTRLKKSDVCAELGIAPRTLDNLVKRNEFPAGVRIGKWSYWSSVAVDKFRERAFHLQESWSPVTSRRR